jgi:hypothetical protein
LSRGTVSESLSNFRFFSLAIAILRPPKDRNMTAVGLEEDVPLKICPKDPEVVLEVVLEVAWERVITPFHAGL